jgi:hypothetical protein
MAYTYDLSTPIGQVRLAIGDAPQNDATGTPSAHFTDAEIQLILMDAANNVGLAAVNALRTWSRQLAALPKQQIGDYTFDPATMAKNLAAAAETLATQLDDELDDPVVMELPGDLWVRV